MSYSIYQLTVPVLTASLDNLSALLAKGEGHAKAHGYLGEQLLSVKLAPDMFALARQIQIACDTAKFCVARIAKINAPKNEDNETTIAQLHSRIQSTIQFLQSVSPEALNQNADGVVEWTTRNEPMSAPTLLYLTRNALPNFYFHLTTAYNLLRMSGVNVGKRDFLGTL